jgi:predicted MFS family arabinose efflux permease
MGPAYMVVTAMYIAAFLLTLGVANPPRRVTKAHPLADLKQAFGYVWRKPDLLGAFTLAFLVNLLGYPIIFGLLPYVAKEVYAIGQAGLGWLAAAFWSGALAGSILVGAGRFPLRAARAMLWNGVLWFIALLLFGQATTLSLGLVLLFVMGFVQSFCLTPLAAVMLRSSDDAMRGRVMGVRMLAIWGLPLGLLATGPMIPAIGYAATTFVYAGLGLIATVAIGYCWREALWNRSATANAA